MDESLKEFERELGALKLRSVDRRLTDRIAEDFASIAATESALEKKHRTVVPNQLIWRTWAGVTGAIAALVAIIVGVAYQSGKAPKVVLPQRGPAVVKSVSAEHRPPYEPTPTDAYSPVAAANVLYEMKDEGPVATNQDGPERRVRYRYVDTYTWKNPHNNASLTWSVPRDEIRVQPAQFN